jgi:hypothetical protein
MNTTSIAKPGEIAESFGQYCARAKPILIGALQQAGAARVCISYDGYGDDGAVGDIVAAARDNGNADISGALDYPTHCDWNNVTRMSRGSLHAALTDFAEVTLAHFYGGWEDNDGALGEIEIDVDAGSLVLTHSTRLMTTEQERTQL